MEAIAEASKDTATAKVPDYAEGNVRAGLGFFCAPFASATIGAIASAIASLFSSDASILTALAFGFGVATPIAYAEAILFGIPIHFLLKWRRLTSLRAYIAAALLLGLLLPGWILVSDRIPDLSWLGIALAMGAAGAAGGSLFWFVARPDQYMRPKRAREREVL